MNSNYSKGGSSNSVGDYCKFGILTISDRATSGEYSDESGPAILQFLHEAIDSVWDCEYRCIPDEINEIENALIEMVDALECNVIVTTGGTGPAKRDVTPEATENVCEKIVATRARGGRIIAVGTTSVRCLETSASSGKMEPFEGQTDLFIYPGYKFRIVDMLITNFHLPESSLLALVSAFSGHAEIMEAYRQAIEAKYRFYSYGDAMMIQ